MPDTKVRVHNLADALGVSSKAIITKCHAEGIELKNHMAVLSAGLEATIREWFSEGVHETTEEHAERVDLQKVKKPRRSKKAAATLADELAPIVEPPTPVFIPDVAAEAPVSQPFISPAVAAEAPSTEPIPAPVPDVVIEPTVEEFRPAAELLTPASTAFASTPPVESKPPALAAPPAGPQNVPRPAQLQGPRVVRMDRPEVFARPVPRPALRSGTSPMPPPAGTGTKRRGAGRGRGADDDDGQAKKGPAGRARVNPRRSVRDEATESGEKLREWSEQDRLERTERIAGAVGRSHRALETTSRKEPSAPRPVARSTKVEITEPVVLKEFCQVTGIGFNQVAPKLMAQGLMATLNKVIDSDVAQLIALEFGLELTVKKAPTPLDRLRERRVNLERNHLQPRPPIVTILGHVDHGKTSLLDRIRNTSVAAGEAGGITQHIGAYTVKVGERSVTFLDTPGHAAFTAMRARGANLTDVAVLVVAANDGMMPQTIEAMNHARAARVPIVVALNKMDLPGVDINKIYGQLSEHSLTPQQWGGETDVIHTSATTGLGVDELLEHLAAMSDLMDLKADPTVPASGTVIEAQKIEGLGQVSRVMVREGTLKAGTIIVCGPAYGKVRTMRDDKGGTLRQAGPATPVELVGLNELPATADEFFTVESMQEAKEVAEDMSRRRRDEELARLTKPTDLESLLAAARGEKIPELNVIIKADVQGSIDVLRKTLMEIPSDEVKLRILHSGAGAVSDGDVMLAAASRALIVAFHVVPETSAQRLADENRVEIRSYRVIYELENDVRRALAGLLPSTEKFESRGRAEVREVFNITRVGRVAGCMVRDGIIARNHKVRILRDSVPIKEGASLASLKRFKDDAREVRAGLECGLRIDGFDDVKPGDIIEAYEVVAVAREL